MWSQIERFTKSAAKRATTAPRFIERLKPRLSCESLNPAAMAVGISGMMTLIVAGHGELMQLGDDGERREFLIGVIDRCDERRVLDYLRNDTSWVIAHVRDRLEREKPIERRFETILDAEVA
jgi:hypothetical protein